MNTVPDFSDLDDLLYRLPARLRLVADYLSREDVLEREAAADLLDECAARLERRRERLAQCNAWMRQVQSGYGLETMPCEEVPHA